MASYIWSGPTGGDWSDPANWTPNGVPGSADAALVNLAGSYTIALDVASIGSLTLDAPGVTIAPSTALTLAGVLDVQSGTFVVSNTITGGTLKLDGGTLAYAGGTLDGVTLAGPLDLSAAGASVSIKDGITFAGSGPEQITVTGSGSTLSFDDAETLNNVAITLGSTTGYYSFISGSALTLGASTTLTTDGNAYLEGQSLDNQGSITAATGYLLDDANTTNQGSIAISDGSTNNYIGSLASNTGTISVSGSGTTLGIYSSSFDNTSGTITVTSGATLNLGTTETTARLGTINHGGGTLNLGGTLDNTGSTLDITKGSTLDGANFTGTITGGTLKLDGGTLAYAGGTLDGVTLAGSLDLSAAGASVAIKDGITFTGSGPEQITVTGSGATLQLQDAETLNNVAITLGSTTGYYSFISGSALTLGASSTLTTDGNAYLNGNSLDNQGSITAATGYLNDQANITNQGSIAISDGSTSNYLDYLTSNTGTISVSGTGTGLDIVNAANSGSIAVTGGATLTTGGTLDNTSGTITLDASSTLYLQSTETTAQLGTITRNGAALTLGGTLDNTGSTLDITKGSLLDGATFNGTIHDGTLKLDGGTVAYAGGTLDGVTLDGPLDLSASNASVSIKDGITFTGAGPEQILDTGNGSTLRLDDPETLNNVAITLGGTTGTSYLYDYYGANTLTLGANSTLTTGGTAYLEVNNLDNKGSITAATGQLVDNYGSTTNEGSIVVSDGSTSNYIGSLASNTGTINVSGTGTGLTIYDSSSTTSIGATSIAENATLTIANTTNALGTVSFLDNTGTLSLDLGNAPGGYDGTLDLFQSGDAIDLAGTGYSLGHVGNTLTVSQGGSVVDSFALAGQDYDTATFTLTANYNETVITTDAPCFCAGTLILTDRGERAVESLEVGDLVVTRQDGVETPMPIRWLGRRPVVVAQHAEAEHVDPVRIARDAIAPGLPVRDLFVSPDHALFLDGVLIQARQLVNHMTITRDSGRTSVTYHHVELDRHAVLIADGIPCESYLDGGNRGQFDAQGTVVPLHPPAADGPQRPCAPLATDAAAVRPVWQRLAERARALGHVAPDPALEPNPLPWLETADGMRLPPHGDGLRFALPSGCVRVRLRSASDRPTTLSPWSDDRRRLGVAISALTLHQGAWRQELALSDLCDEAGWWPLEIAGALAWRWTDGDGWIELPEPAEAIGITLHATMQVPARSSVSLGRAPSPVRARAG